MHFSRGLGEPMFDISLARQPPALSAIGFGQVVDNLGRRVEGPFLADRCLARSTVADPQPPVEPINSYGLLQATTVIHACGGLDQSRITT